jgi:hypothetical protein
MMKGWTRFFMSVVTVMVVFALSAMWTVPVLADDGAPPLTETPAESQPAEEAPPAEQAPTEAAPADEAPPAQAELTEAAPAEAAAVEELPPAEQVTAETPAPEESALELLAQVPEGTEVVVVNEGGEAVPLATEEAAQIIASGDPIWCPTGVAPIASTGGCSTTYTLLENLISNIVADMGAQPSANGVIWIKFGADTSTSATIDASTFTTWKNFSLTLKGGWNGVSGSTITNPLTPSEFGVPLEIKGWNNAVTLNDISVLGAASGPALSVNTSGKVTLTRVKVQGNFGPGAKIDNTAGTGDVLVSTGDFNSNDGRGLEILSKGMITLADVSAGENSEEGVYLDNHTAPSPKNVVMTSGEFEFTLNGGNGLTIHSIGAVLLKDLTLTGNFGVVTGVVDPVNALWVNNCGDTGYDVICTGAGSGGVSMTGTNLIGENHGGGMLILSKGAISINNLIANANDGGSAAYIDNSNASTAQPVTLSGTNEAIWNGNGVRIFSRGAVTINNLSSTNSYIGLFIKNDNGFNSNVTLTGSNTFMDNSTYGIEVTSLGAISMNNVNSQGNGWGDGGWGALLDNGGATIPEAVKLSGTNEFSGNQGGGLSIVATGAVTLSNLSANENQSGNGVQVDNKILGNGMPQNVTLTGYGYFNHNNGNGLNVDSYGTIMLANLTASENSNTGAWLLNYHVDALSPKAISLSGNNTFEWNKDTGLVIYSYGAITVNNLRANDNVDYGVYLANSMGSTTAGINVINTPTYKPEIARNGLDGLLVWSNGAIVLKDFDAHDNGGVGVYLDNTGGVAANVTVGTGRLNWCNGMWSNTSSGMAVLSKGMVTMSNLCVDNNGDYGVTIANQTAGTPKAVILNGENTFNGNNLTGLYITSKGAITLNKVSANENINEGGIYLRNTNSGSGSPQNVTLNGYGEFQNNGGYGLDLNTYGTVVLNNLHAQGNASNGIDVDNWTGAVTPKAVTINGYARVYDNEIGLQILSMGAIKVNSLDAHDNVNGANLDNHQTGGVGGVTITSGAWTGNNTGNGLTVQSLGAITFTVIDAWGGDNVGYGWLLDNSFNGASGGITMSVSSTQNFDFNNNGSYGLWAKSLGAIKVTNLSAGGNGWDGGGWGAWLDNSSSGAAGSVTIASTGKRNEFNENSAGGLTVDSKGAITVANLEADSNGNAGAVLNNTHSGMGSPQKVTLSGYGNFFNNGASGLAVASYGLITTNNLTANDNGQNHGVYGWGAWLDNCGYDSGSVDCLSTGVPQGISLNGTNNFHNNYKDGLWATSLGLIKANSISSSGNERHGAYMDNQWDDTHTYGIKLTGTNYFENNSMDGILAYSNGSITISNLNANWNKNDGADLNTHNTITAPANVILTGTNNFLGNGTNNGIDPPWGSGLWVDATGVITINNLTANWNQEYGAHLDNYIGGYWRPIPALTISLTGTNTFYRNGADGLSDGLYFNSYGNVSLVKITADANGDDGVDGHTAANPGDPVPNITITCGRMTANAVYGYYLNASGTVTLIGVTGYGNPTSNAVSSPFVIVRTCPLP